MLRWADGISYYQYILTHNYAIPSVPARILRLKQLFVAQVQRDCQTITTTTTTMSYIGSGLRSSRCRRGSIGDWNCVIIIIIIIGSIMNIIIARAANYCASLQLLNRWISLSVAIALHQLQQLDRGGDQDHVIVD